MTNSGPTRATRPNPALLLTVPKGDVLGTYDTYPEAQSVVDRLAKADFAVAQVSIVGNDLKTVERVTRKLSWNRSALEGALSGAWFGLFIGLIFGIFSPTTTLAFYGAAVLIGAVFGLFFRLITYAINRRTRDFDSTHQVLASNYQVLVGAGHVEAAQDALAKQPAE